MHTDPEVDLRRTTRRAHRRSCDRGQRDQGAAQRHRGLPLDARGDRRCTALDRLPDLRVLGGPDRHRVRRAPRCPSPRRACACACSSTRSGVAPSSASLVEMMDDAGVHIRWFRPFRRLHLGAYNHRTHRKVMIVDEGTGFTGGIGIADEWDGDARNENEWRDTHFRVRGPAVDGLRAAFLDNWAETDPVLYDPDYDHFPVQPTAGSTTAMCVRGASETGSSDIATLFRGLLQAAEKSIRITTAYFVPEGDLLDRLCDAGDRGIDVQVLVPGPHADKRFVQLAGEALVQAASRSRRHDLVLPAVDAPRQGADRRRSRGDHRVGQLQQSIGFARRGDQRRRLRHRPRRNPRPPVRGRRRAERAPRRDALGSTARGLSA